MEDKEKYTCDACGRIQKGYTFIKAVFQDITENSEDYKNLMEIYGKTEFNICIFCYLKKLGVKKKIKVDIESSFFKK